MPVSFEEPPTNSEDELTADASGVTSKDIDNINRDNTISPSKMRQTKVIDHCSHGTHTLEQKLKLEGKPIEETKSVAGVSRSLVVQIIITMAFCLMEFVTGVVCSSIAMLADSYHMAADVMALIVAYVCIKIATRPSTRHGYGWVRAETLGGFFNGIFMITVCVSVIQEALGRCVNPHLINRPAQVFVIGTIGLLINLYGMFNLNEHGHSHGGGGHGHSHGGGHGHSHGPSKKKTEKHENHGHSHDHHHGKCDGDHKHDHNEAADSSSQVGRSDALTRLLDNEDGEEHVERRLSSVTNQNAIIATVDRQMTPYGTHIASDVLNSSSSDVTEENDDEEEETETKSKKKKERNDNIHGVWLHLLSDAFGSVIVMLSSAVVFCWPNARIALYLDPLLSMALASIMGFTAVVLVKTSGEKLLKRTPDELNLKKVKKDLCKIAGVSKVDKLSVWTLCGPRIIAAAHVNFCHPAVFADASFKIKKYFHDMGVHSTTIEPTFEDTCMQSMKVMVKKVLNGKSIEEITISTENETGSSN